MGSQTYRVRHQERNRRSLVVHSAQMKRYHARESAGDRQQEHHIRDEGQKADMKMTATWPSLGLHPLRKVQDELL
ncbi:hypothetical protein T02_9039 [Trichinella nativa]|uniref:Integrase p58-like C-terminal domain-containing protein n=1 Tax=Trichinella nativa TaxID=6335 RepID=A0A0V1KZR3_9BILA|nr:hypothetical protein T02_9039 [Trichinella nativa]